MNIFDIAKQNQEKAWQVIKNTNIIQIWEDAGAKINLVGSLRTGLLMKLVEKLKRRGFEVTIDNIYAHIQDVAGVRVICNYLDDICYLRSLLARNENFKIIREVNSHSPRSYRGCF